MKKNLLKVTALVIAMGMCFTGVPQVVMAAESSINYQKVASFGPTDGVSVMDYLTMEEIAAWADMYGYEYEAREIDGGTKLYVVRVDEANSGQTAGTGDVGEAVLEGGSGYITGVVNAGVKMAQNANEKGVENAKEGYASVMNSSEEPAYVVYMYVFENGNPYCIYMEQIVPTGNRENFIDAFYANYNVSKKYDLTGYRDYNVFIGEDGSSFIVGPINRGNVYDIHYIPGDNPEKYSMVEYIISNVK